MAKMTHGDLHIFLNRPRRHFIFPFSIINLREAPNSIFYLNPQKSAGNRKMETGNDMDGSRKVVFTQETAGLPGKRQKERKRYEEQQPDQCPSGPGGYGQVQDAGCLRGRCIFYILKAAPLCNTNKIIHQRFFQFAYIIGNY